VEVAHSDVRWCSDGFKFKCDSGQPVTATFTKDCCDREILDFRPWEGKGLPGELSREMLIEAVEKRLGRRSHRTSRLRRPHAAGLAWAAFDRNLCGPVR